MIKTFIKVLSISFLFLSACGSDESNKCDDSDFSVRGICVKTNGFIIDTSMFEWSILEAEHEWLQFYPSMSLQDTFESNELKVSYIEDITINARGYYNEHTKSIVLDYKFVNEFNIPEYINYPPELLQCVETYYVFQHELMHYALDIYDLEDHQHMVPNVFLDYCEANDLPWEQCVEGNFYKITWNECARRFIEGSLIQ